MVLIANIKLPRSEKSDLRALLRSFNESEIKTGY